MQKLYRGAHADNMEKGELDSDVTTLVTGSFVPSETLVPGGEVHGSDSRTIRRAGNRRDA